MKDIVWILRPLNDNTSLVDLIKKYQNREPISLNDFEVFTVPSVVHGFKNEFIDYITTHGLSSLISSEILLEHVVQKGTSDSSIIAIIQKYMDKIDVDGELIIVDPYFFAARPKNPNYTIIFDQIIDKYLSTIDNIIIITNSFAVDMTVKNAIISNLISKKPGINIIHNQNDDYHDRYWISGAREKGLLIGSSLNSLGNKIALVDRINTSDVRAIVTELSDDGLL